MDLGAVTRPTMRLFHDLVDDAGLFPPTALPMDEALARHRGDLEAGHPVLTHRFLCPASRLPALRAGLSFPIRLGLILDTPDLPPLDGLDVELVEIPGARFTTPSGRVELPAGLGLPETKARRFVEVTAAQLPVRLPAGAGLKIRCGGLSAEAFPSPHDLGAFISHCAEHGIPFKATAGLHHAVRHFDPALGADRHGFLNLVLAVCAAAGRRPGAGVEADRRGRAGAAGAGRTGRDRAAGQGAAGVVRLVQHGHPDRRPARPRADRGGRLMTASPWGLDNLPYGVFSRVGGETPGSASGTATTCSTWPARCTTRCSPPARSTPSWPGAPPPGATPAR
nr:hypothetical protein GCM10020093_065660 [Planobispora longispora]